MDHPDNAHVTDNSRVQAPTFYPDANHFIYHSPQARQSHYFGDAYQSTLVNQPTRHVPLVPVAVAAQVMPRAPVQSMPSVVENNNPTLSSNTTMWRQISIFTGIALAAVAIYILLGRNRRKSNK